MVAPSGDGLGRHSHRSHEQEAKAIVLDRLRLYAQLGEDQSWQPDEAKGVCSNQRPTGISASRSREVQNVGQQLRVVTAAAFLVELLKYAATVVVAATVVLVELLDREALVSRSGSNCTSNERQSDKRGKDGLHDQSPKGLFCFTEACCLVLMK